MKFTIRIIEDVEKFVEEFSDERLKIDGSAIVFDGDDNKFVSFSWLDYDYSFLAEQGGDPKVVNFLYPHEVIKGDKDFPELLKGWSLILEDEIEESLKKFFSTYTPEHLIKLEQYINEKIIVLVFDVPDEILLLQKLQGKIP
jgi:hypothetical protein